MSVADDVSYRPRGPWDHVLLASSIAAERVAVDRTYDTTYHLAAMSVVGVEVLVEGSPERRIAASCS